MSYSLALLLLHPLLLCAIAQAGEKVELLAVKSISRRGVLIQLQNRTAPKTLFIVSNQGRFLELKLEKADEQCNRPTLNCPKACENIGVYRTTRSKPRGHQPKATFAYAASTKPSGIVSIRLKPSNLKIETFLRGVPRPSKPKVSLNGKKRPVLFKANNSQLELRSTHPDGRLLKWKCPLPGIKIRAARSYASFRCANAEFFFYKKKLLWWSMNESSAEITGVFKVGGFRYHQIGNPSGGPLRGVLAESKHTGDNWLKKGVDRWELLTLKAAPARCTD